MVVVQAESAEAVRNIDRIVQVPGLDAVLIGPCDLSASLGHPGDLAHPDFRDAVDSFRIASRLPGSGAAAGHFCHECRCCPSLHCTGVPVDLLSVDTVLLGQAARDLLRWAR